MAKHNNAYLRRESKDVTNSISSIVLIKLTNSYLFYYAIYLGGGSVLTDSEVQMGCWYPSVTGFVSYISHTGTEYTPFDPTLGF